MVQVRWQGSPGEQKKRTLFSARLVTGTLSSYFFSMVATSLEALTIKVSSLGGAVAEWSMALQWREKINEKKIPGSPPGLGNL